MRRIGILLALMIAFTLSLPAQAALAKAKSSSAQENSTKHQDRVDVSPARNLESSEQKTEANPASQNSGRGMNREGSPSLHPGKGWKDPGQVQGSVRNTADPDCTGNRTTSPQHTNKGSCDNPNGAADKPGGTGGFNSDRDFNNGCGNDSDFEDDNNGLCGGKHNSHHDGGADGSQPSRPPTAVLSQTSAAPVLVLSEKIRTVQPLSIPGTLPRTGVDPTVLLIDAVGLISAGRVLVKKASRSRKRAGRFRLFSSLELL